MEINKLMNESIELMECGFDVDHAIKNAFTGDEEFDLYYHACIYYNYQEYQSCVKSLIELYHKYSKADANLFLFAFEQLVDQSHIIEDIVFADICCVHSSLQKIYSEEQILRLNKSIFKYVMMLVNLEQPLPSYIHDMLGDIIDPVICHLLPKTRKKPTKFYDEINMGNLKGKTVINCYYNESCGGIGDFLKGSCYLFETLKDNKINFKINLSQHDIGTYVQSKSRAKCGKVFDVEKTNKHLCTESNYFENIKFNLTQLLSSSRKKNISLFSNYCDLEYLKPNKKISKECQKFMKKNLIFNKSIINAYKTCLKDNKINEYIVMHFRTGDYNILKGQYDSSSTDGINTKKYTLNFDSIKNQILNKQKDTNKDIIVMSDSNDLKKYIQNISDRVHTIHFNSQHSSNNPGHIKSLSINSQKKKDNMFYVALDMKILSKAQEIHSYSVYPWGSAFCFWISKIYDIPININLLRGE
jgi:hypothetical protein